MFFTRIFERKPRPQRPASHPVLNSDGMPRGVVPSPDQRRRTCPPVKGHRATLAWAKTGSLEALRAVLDARDEAESSLHSTIVYPFDSSMEDWCPCVTPTTPSFLDMPEEADLGLMQRLSSPLCPVYDEEPPLSPLWPFMSSSETSFGSPGPYTPWAVRGDGSLPESRDFTTRRAPPRSLERLRSRKRCPDLDFTVEQAPEKAHRPPTPAPLAMRRHCAPTPQESSPVLSFSGSIEESSQRSTPSPVVQTATRATRVSCPPVLELRLRPKVLSSSPRGSTRFDYPDMAFSSLPSSPSRGLLTPVESCVYKFHRLLSKLPQVLEGPPGQAVMGSPDPRESLPDSEKAETPGQRELVLPDPPAFRQDEVHSESEGMSTPSSASQAILTPELDDETPCFTSISPENQIRTQSICQGLSLPIDTPMLTLQEFLIRNPCVLWYLTTGTIAHPDWVFEHRNAVHEVHLPPSALQSNAALLKAIEETDWDDDIVHVLLEFDREIKQDNDPVILMEKIRRLGKGAVQLPLYKELCAGDRLFWEMDLKNIEEIRKRKEQRCGSLLRHGV